MSSDTAAAVRQWIAGAGGDWTAVQILRADPRGPGAAICFHCQQYVEKLLKALLTLHGIEAPRTHDLRRLIQLCCTYLPELKTLADGADDLTLHAVETRYPGDQPEVSTEEVAEMITLAGQFASLLLPRLQVGG